jgi:hypothetical protein
MARKVSGNRRTRQAKGILSETSVAGIKQNLGGYNFKNLGRRLRGNSLLLNVGIGVGTFFAVRSAIRYVKANPAIVDFFRENLDTVEAKFREYRGGSSEDTIADARH